VKEGGRLILAAKGKYPIQEVSRVQEIIRRDVMCIVCEHELWDEHRALEREFFEPCKICKNFPGTSTEGTCYHCFAVGNTIDECPECVGKPWSEEFLGAKEEIEGPDKVLIPF
jgi:hypothetical protein